MPRCETLEGAGLMLAGRDRVVAEEAVCRASASV